MTLQEILKAKGMTDEDIESTIGEMKQNKIFTTSHENMDERYPKLKTQYENLNVQHGESAKLIQQFEAGAKDNEALQGKIAEYKAQMEQLNEKLKEVQIENAVTLKLADAKCNDVPYAIYKLKEQGALELDDKGQVRDIDSKIDALKTMIPKQFDTEEGGDGYREVDVHKLDKGNGHDNTPTKAEFAAMSYEQRVALKQQNEELYRNLKK